MNGIKKGVFSKFCHEKCKAIPPSPDNNNVKKPGFFGLFFCLLAFALAFVLAFAACFSACDLFNPLPETDLENKIDEQVKWAQAEPITVTVAYPQEWGSSPQNGPGNCRDDQRDAGPRVGYTFTVQFDPFPAYSDADWVAYRTSDLPEGNSWYINETSITGTLDNVTAAGKLPLNENEISIIPDGGKSTVLVKTQGAITLIPLCKPQPRIILSNTPLNAKWDDEFPHLHDRDRDITITFAAPLDPSTLKYAPTFIEIMGREVFSEAAFTDQSDLFAQPRYNEDTYTLTILPSGHLPVDWFIEVTLGEGIERDVKGKGMDPVSFSFKTIGITQTITRWNASYNDTDQIIEVAWEVPPEAEGIIPDVRYRVDSGNYTRIPTDSDTQSVVINAPRINDGGVLDGIAPSGLHAYTITIDLGGGITQLGIWNISGMSVNQGNPNPIREISNETQLRNIRNDLNDDYVLTNDIELTEPWTPLGNYDDSPTIYFTGKFYGAGRTITINSFNKATFTGLFGYANNALIRDLTLVFNNTVVSNSTTTHLGALAGYADSSTEIRNIITRGSLSAELSTNEEIYVGGLVGFTGNDVTISNCLADVDIELSCTAAGTDDVFFGGISGDAAVIGVNDIADKDNHRITVDTVVVSGALEIPYSFTSNGKVYLGGLMGRASYSDIRNSWVSGDINCDKAGTGTLYCGGIIGDFNLSTAEDTRYERGSITAGGGGILHLGGGFGRLTNADVSNCRSLALLVSGSRSGPAESVTVGGFAGYLADMETLNGNYSRAEVRATGGSAVYAGGLVGIFSPPATSDYEISECYASGNVYAVRSGSNNNPAIIAAGGLVGCISRETNPSRRISIENSYALGNVSAHGTEGTNVYAGGLVGIVSGAGASPRVYYIQHCFAAGSVSTKSISAAYSSGLVGYISENNSDLLMEYNAALGTSVTAMGASSYARGVLRYPNTVTIFLSNNYALRSMFLGTSVYTASPYPNYSQDLTPVLDGENGEGIAYAELTGSNFWQNTIDFDSGIWDFKGVSRGYPLLKNVGGQW